MILHLSHIFLTEGRTFISQFLSVMRSLLYTNVQPQTLLPRFGEENPRFPLLEAVRDAPAIQVVDGQLDRDLIAFAYFSVENILSGVGLSIDVK